MSSLPELLEEAVDGLEKAIEDVTEKFREMDFGEIRVRADEQLCVKTLLGSRRLRAVETDTARAVQLRSGAIQVCSEGNTTRAYTIDADDVQAARKALVKERYSDDTY